MPTPLTATPTEDVMVYVHVPFCHAKCAYCDFYSTPVLSLADAYLEALAGEWNERRTPGMRPITLYVGGGTPSSLPQGGLSRIVSAINPGAPLAEATVEANPEDVSPRWADEALEVLGAISLNPRVSMGVQSLDDSQLSFIGRRHTSWQALDAVSTLRTAGFDNISLDLIYGLPGQTLDSWRSSLSRILELRPAHLSAYLLSYEPRTRLGVMLEKGKVEEASDSLAEQMYLHLCRAAREAGYVHYEISNFALPGREAIHNSGYWNSTPYIGLGPGAHSFLGGVRGSVAPNLREYIKAGGRGLFQAEEETEANRFNDLLLTALRTSRGLDPSLSGFSPEILGPFGETVSTLLRSGELIVNSSGRLAIPEEKWLTSNSTLLKLIAI